MLKEFFLRFSLQQMGGCMSQDVYTVKQAINVNAVAIDRYSITVRFLFVGTVNDVFQFLDHLFSP